MGWIESIYIFYAASEIGKVVGKNLLQEKNLLSHKLENIIMSNTKIIEKIIDDTDNLMKLFKVHVDNFIAIVQTKTEQELYHVSRALLHGIDSIFPEGISISKLYKEEKWESSKDILGWIFDRVARTMTLPPEKNN